MRAMLIILIVLGLMLNSGGGFVASGHAKTFAGAAENAHAAHHKMHARDKAGGCHKLPAQSSPHKWNCCDEKSKCAADGCACLECLNVLAGVWPASLNGLAFSATHEPDRFDKPPDKLSQPPAPPPQLRSSMSL
jgi:hypothetical protein